MILAHQDNDATPDAPKKKVNPFVNMLANQALKYYQNNKDLINNQASKFGINLPALQNQAAMLGIKIPGVTQQNAA